MRKLTAILMACMLCLCGVAAAENAEASFAAAQPLIDLTVAAALTADDSPENISADQALSEDFVYHFFLMGQKMSDSLGITPDYLSSPDKQTEYLQKVLPGQLPDEMGGILSLGESGDYIGIRVSAADFDSEGNNVRLVGDAYQAAASIDRLSDDQTASLKWLDHRAVLELTKSDASPCGWRVVSCSFDGELDVEKLTNDYFNATMAEYAAGELGFSIEYPAVFTEDTLVEENGSLSATLTDGSASFFVKRTDNPNHDTPDAVAEGYVREYPEAETTVNPATSSVKAVRLMSDGKTAVDMMIVSENYVYQAQLTYSADRAKEFSLYADYMMNSFNADELGVG